MMYSFAKPEAVRSFRESWKRDPDCAICYWGEAWAWGSYLNAPMTAGGGAARVRGDPEGAVAEERTPTPKERALIDAMAVRYVEQFDRRHSASSRIAPTPRRWSKLAEQYPDDLDIADALRRRAVPARAAPRHARRQRPNVKRLHQVLETGAVERRPSPRRVPPLRARDRIDGGAGPRRGLRRVSRQLDSRREPHQSHAVAHLERSRPLGRFGARQPRGLAFGPEGGDRRRLRDLSRAQPAHAALRGVATTDRARSRCAPARTTRS